MELLRGNDYSDSYLEPCMERLSDFHVLEPCFCSGMCSSPASSSFAGCHLNPNLNPNPGSKERNTQPLTNIDRLFLLPRNSKSHPRRDRLSLHRPCPAPLHPLQHGAKPRGWQGGWRQARGADRACRKAVRPKRRGARGSALALALARGQEVTKPA